MTFTITPNVSVRRDAEGRVRHLEHLREPYSAPEAETPEELADLYLHEVAEHYDIESDAIRNLGREIPGRPTHEGTGLHRRAAKSTAGSVTVSYLQSYIGLRVWGADFNVHLARDPLRVTSSYSTLHPDVRVAAPERRHLEPAGERELLEGLASAFSRSGLQPARISGSELLIYRYDPDARFDDEVQAVTDGVVPPGGVPAPALPPVPDTFEDGAQYVAREILFTMEVPGWNELNWRTLVDVESGVVLYIRALVARATGSVFPSDPVSLSGGNHTAASPASQLDPLRQPVTLQGLVSSDPQDLVGEFVKIEDIVPKLTPPPTEPPPGDFSYSAVTDDFAAVSAYHHLDAAYRLLENLGFDTAAYFDGTTFPVIVDHRGMFEGFPPDAPNPGTGAIIDINAAGTGTKGFRFGLVTAGEPVGIAATPRVVLHEFGHALLVDHLHSPNFGFAHGPGDSLAAILHDPGSKAPDRYLTAPFVSTSNPSPSNRRHDRKVSGGWAWFGPHYDTNYKGTQVLSSTLFRLYESIGGNSADSSEREFASLYVTYLIVKAIGTMTSQSTDPVVFASALMNADLTTADLQGVPGGRVHKVVRWAFEKQGLYQAPGTPTPYLTEGEPPDVDVYINDGRHGEYRYSPGVGLVSGWIWNRHAPDRGADHQPPHTDRRNFVYVLIGNRGTARADNVTVRAFHSGAADFAEWPVGWTAMAPGPRSVAGVAPGAIGLAGPFEWLPTATDRTALLAVVSADGDLANDVTVAGTVDLEQFVPFDNNIAVRLVQPRPSFESRWKAFLNWLSAILSRLLGG